MSYVAGQAQADQVSDSVSQMGDKVDQTFDRLNNDLQKERSEKEAAQQQIDGLQDQVNHYKALAESQSAEIARLRAAQEASKSFWSRWFCFSKPRTGDE